MCHRFGGLLPLRSSNATTYMLIIGYYVKNNSLTFLKKCLPTPSLRFSWHRQQYFKVFPTYNFFFKKPSIGTASFVQQYPAPIFLKKKVVRHIQKP